MLLHNTWLYGLLLDHKLRGGKVLNETGQRSARNKYSSHSVFPKSLDTEARPEILHA
jgi:hypothetical protein